MYIEQNNIIFLNDILTIINEFPTNIIPIIESNKYGSVDTLLAGKEMYNFDGNIIKGNMSDTHYYSIIDRTISNFTDNTNTINEIRDYAFTSCTSLTSVSFPVCTSIGSGAFYRCSSLTSISFPVCTRIGSYAFYSCSKLTSVSFPACSTIGYGAFSNCSNLTSVSFPACTYIGNSAFQSCTSLTSVSFPACTYIGNSAFQSCTSLTSLTLGASTVCTLNRTNAFTGTPMSNSTYTGTYGSIYVPASLVDAYKSATNWATYSSRIGSIE